MNVERLFNQVSRTTLGLIGAVALVTGAHAADFTNAAAQITYKGSNPYAGTMAYRAPELPTQVRPRMQMPQASVGPVPLGSPQSALQNLPQAAPRIPAPQMPQGYKVPLRQQPTPLISPSRPITGPIKGHGLVLVTPPKAPAANPQAGLQAMPAPREAQPQAQPQFTPAQPQQRPQAQASARPVMPQGPKLFDPSKIDPNIKPYQRLGKPYTVNGKRYFPKHEPGYNVVGTASWYGDKFHGKLTANGEKYDKRAMTAAHKTLPMNSMVFVTNMQTGKSIMLRINDRGPFVGDRIIDLSEAAAEYLGVAEEGLGTVRVQYAGPAPKPGSKQAEVTQKPVPVMPQVPSKSAAAPSAPNYQPLRRQGQLPVPYVPTLPKQQQAPMKAQPQTQAEARPQTVPLMPRTLAPQARPAAPNVSVPNVAMPQVRANRRQQPPIPMPTPSQEGDSSQVTLTIKGPIHMANHQVTF